ncbi:Phage protein Gp37/Gp68 [compost metagenome]
MSDKTGIEWCDSTWNPVTGCSKVSEGCRNCYAKTFTERFEGTPGHYFEAGFKVTLRPEKLGQPLRWKRPRKIFVNSMSDLFHPDVPDDYIDQVFYVMAIARQHTYQILTKRPERMRDWILQHGWIMSEFPHVWLGVSVENQQAADERIPPLLQIPAVVRFLSCEPLLGPVDLNAVPRPDNAYFMQRGEQGCITDPKEPDDYVYWHKRDQIHWVIVGGESGHNARPMHPDWARSLRDQCQSAGVPFLFKQWGEWVPTNAEKDTGVYVPGVFPGDVCMSPNGECDVAPENYICFFNETEGTTMRKIGKKKAGRLLDGRTWDEFPEVKS